MSNKEITLHSGAAAGSGADDRKRAPLEGELLLKKGQREAGGRYKIGDYVSRDGTDVHLVVDLNEAPADLGLFRCVVEPRPYDEDGEPWTRIGEEEWNLTRRYDLVDYTPPSKPSAGIEAGGLSRQLRSSGDQEACERRAWALGAYIGGACPNCNRERLCLCDNGKTRCEKCNWVPEDGDYCPVQL